MRNPQLTEIPVSRSVIDQFAGYNCGTRIQENEFSEMMNMSSDRWPVLAPREGYGAPSGDSPIESNVLSMGGAIYFVDNGNLVKWVDGAESARISGFDGCNALVAFGAYIIGLPGRKWFNTIDLTNGGIDETVILSNKSIALCDREGGKIDAVVSATEPAMKYDGEYWLDTSTNPPSLNMYSMSYMMWLPSPTNYAKIKFDNAGFKEGDGVTITGAESFGISGTYIITAADTTGITIPALINKEGTVPSMTIDRKMPMVDFVFESGNRLWGCRYGTANNGQFVNEVYASKLGDFRNWNYYNGTADDSYTASIGTDGPFTGGINYQGYPHFFKENCLHKVYGMYPAQYQIHETRLRGVLSGCADSLASVNEVLFYVSSEGVMAYDGSLPSRVSDAIPIETVKSAVGGSWHGKYFLVERFGNMLPPSERFYVFDTEKRMWYPESGTGDIRGFFSLDDSLYVVSRNGYLSNIRRIRKGYKSGEAEPTELVSWHCVTGQIGVDSPDTKILQRVDIRLKMAAGSRLTVSIDYDSEGNWSEVCTMEAERMKSFTIPIRPRRCDHLRLKFDGEGDCEICSIAKAIEGGSRGNDHAGIVLR